MYTLNFSYFYFAPIILHPLMVWTWIYTFKFKPMKITSSMLFKILIYVVFWGTFINMLSNIRQPIKIRNELPHVSKGGIQCWQGFETPIMIGIQYGEEKQNYKNNVKEYKKKHYKNTTKCS